MSTLPPTTDPFDPFQPEGGPLNVSFEEHAIGGKLFVAKASFDQSMLLTLGNEEAWRARVRETLIRQIVDFILQNKLCETTSFRDIADQKINVAARLYLAPNDQIKVLRTRK